MRLFADDCLLYRPIRSQADVASVQNDLDNLQLWENEWLMSFNPDKCEVLRVTNKRTRVIQSNYFIHGSMLRNVDSAKYLGITIAKNLSWKDHVNVITKKANSTLGFLRRNLRRCPQETKELAYNTYVRPTLEYASSVWDSDVKDQIASIERIQRRAARFVKADFNYRHSVSEMLYQLQWPSLQERRAHTKMTFMYRIVHNLVSIPVQPPYLFPSTISNRGHQYRFSQQHCRIQAYQHSFFPSAVRLWNSLPPAVVAAQSLELFKNRLKSLTLC